LNIRIIPASWTPYLLAILRIMTGLLFLEHGTAKLFDFPMTAIGSQEPHGLLLFTGSMELVGGALIIVGFLTRPVAFVLSGYMAVAYFMAHLPAGFFPVNNHGELAILFCFVFFYLAAAGAGTWAVDKA
jgi:putative oxidoreductase